MEEKEELTHCPIAKKNMEPGFYVVKYCDKLTIGDYDDEYGGSWHILRGGCGGYCGPDDIDEIICRINIDNVTADNVTVPNIEIICDIERVVTDDECYYKMSYTKG